LPVRDVAGEAIAKAVILSAMFTQGGL